MKQTNKAENFAITAVVFYCNGTCTGCGNKVSPKVFRCFLSNRLEF